MYLIGWRIFFFTFFTTPTESTLTLPLNENFLWKIAMNKLLMSVSLLSIFCGFFMNAAFTRFFPQLESNQHHRFGRSKLLAIDFYVIHFPLIFSNASLDSVTFFKQQKNEFELPRTDAVYSLFSHWILEYQIWYILLPNGNKNVDKPFFCPPFIDNICCFELKQRSTINVESKRQKERAVGFKSYFFIFIST